MMKFHNWDRNYRFWRINSILNHWSPKSMLKISNLCKREMSIIIIRKRLKSHLTHWLINTNHQSNSQKNYEIMLKSTLKSKNRNKTNWSNKLLKNKRPLLRQDLKNRSTSLKFKKKSLKRQIKLLNTRSKT